MPPIADSQIMISTRGLMKRFGDHQVLDGVDLDVRAGETHVILGRSGCGKSVMLKLICGLLSPDAGQIMIDGRQLYPSAGGKRREALAKIQMLFQGSALFDSMTVAQNVAFHGLEHHRLKPSATESFARQYLEMVDLAAAGAKMPSELSGGMKKRAALARALAASPKIMLYDEPTTGLDPLTSQVINNLIRETQQRFGVTSVVVTHDLRSTLEVGDRCSFLEGGRILETTTPGKLSASAHAIIQDFSEKAAVNP